MARTTVIYLYHLERKYAHAQHYLGSTADLAQRDREHQSGQGNPLLRAAKAAGIAFAIVRTWPGGRKRERALKNMKAESRLCPVCNPHNHRGEKTNDE